MPYCIWTHLDRSYIVWTQYKQILLLVLDGYEVMNTYNMQVHLLIIKGCLVMDLKSYYYSEYIIVVQSGNTPSNEIRCVAEAEKKELG